MARYPSGRVYKHRYGGLTVSARSREGTYLATVHRESDGYEVTVETPEGNPLDAARYALLILADAWREGSENEALARAAEAVGEDAAEALSETGMSGARMGDSPRDDLFLWSDNDEGMYNAKLSLYDGWIGEGDSWNENRALDEAAALAAEFARAVEAKGYVEGKYTEGEIRQAAVEMMEQFADYREEAIRSAVEQVRRKPTEEELRMTPGEAEHAAKYEALAREIGIDAIRELIPASEERIRLALSRGDKHLNTVPLRKWDAAAVKLSTGARRLSLGERVSLLKHVAKWHYA